MIIIPNFDPHPGKNDPHIRIPAGFTGSGWGKPSGEKCLDSRAFGGNPVRAFPPVFRQSGQYFSLFSPGTESGVFTGFSGISRDMKKAKGARIGLI